MCNTGADDPLTLFTLQCPGDNLISDLQLCSDGKSVTWAIYSTDQNPNKGTLSVSLEDAQFRRAYVLTLIPADSKSDRIISSNKWPHRATFRDAHRKPIKQSALSGSVASANLDTNTSAYSRLVPKPHSGPDLERPFGEPYCNEHIKPKYKRAFKVTYEKTIYRTQPCPYRYT